MFLHFICKKISKSIPQKSSITHEKIKYTLRLFVCMCICVCISPCVGHQNLAILFRTSVQITATPLPALPPISVDMCLEGRGGGEGVIEQTCVYGRQNSRIWRTTSCFRICGQITHLSEQAPVCFLKRIFSLREIFMIVRIHESTWTFFVSHGTCNEKCDLIQNINFKPN